MRNSKRSVRANRSNWFNLSVATIMIVGIALVLASRNPNGAGNVGPKISGKGGQTDHWHAAIGVYICDAGWESAPLWPASTSTQKLGRKQNPTLYAGLHTHVLADNTGDGTIHMEPAASDESGRNATVGKFTQFGGWNLTSTSMSLWPGKDNKPIKRSNGQKCGKKAGTLRWAVGQSKNGAKVKLVEQKGNPAKYKLYDDDVVALYFVPADEKLDKLGDVPSVKNLTGATQRGEGASSPTPTPTPSSGVTLPTTPTLTGTTVKGAVTTTKPTSSPATPTSVSATTTK